jgi:hypothetical protein
MHSSSPSEALGFTGLRGKEVSSTTKLLTASGGVWLECRYVRGSGTNVFMDRHRCFSNGGHRRLAIGSDE